MSQGNSALLSISAARGAIRSRARVRTSSLISRCSAVSTSCGTAGVSQGDMRPAPRSRRSGAAVVPDRLDVVAVWVEQVGTVVAGVVLRAFAGTAVVATAGEQAGVVECPHRLSVTDAEREVQVARRRV